MFKITKELKTTLAAAIALGPLPLAEAGRSYRGGGGDVVEEVPGVAGHKPRLLTLISPARRGVYNAYFTFFDGKSTHFAVHFIQNDTKLTLSQTLGHYDQSLHYNLAFQKS